jgi:antirestriction protein ArdC
MPPIESFRDAESFVAALAHESIHRTKHPSQLNLEYGRKAWATKATPAKNSLPNWVLPSSALILNSRRKYAKTTPPTSAHG